MPIYIDDTGKLSSGQQNLHFSCLFTNETSELRVSIDRKVLMRPKGPELCIIFKYLICIELN